MADFAFSGTMFRIRADKSHLFGSLRICPQNEFYGRFFIQIEIPFGLHLMVFLVDGPELTWDSRMVIFDEIERNEPYIRLGWNTRTRVAGNGNNFKEIKEYYSYDYFKVKITTPNSYEKK